MVTVRSGFAALLPLMLVSAELLISTAKNSPLSGVTRLITNFMPTAFLLSMLMPRKFSHSSVDMARTMSGPLALGGEPCGMPWRSS